MTLEQIRLEQTAQVWWGMGNRREIRWSVIVGWCFGAANATNSDDWWTLYNIADERVPEDYERAA